MNKGQSLNAQINDYEYRKVIQLPYQDFKIEEGHLTPRSRILNKGGYFNTQKRISDIALL